MRIIGIDPGLRLTGYACMHLSPGSLEPSLIEAGVIRLNPRMSMAGRLAQLHRDLAELIEECKPNVLAVEKLFTHYRHLRTSLLMGHARGVVLLAGELHDLQIEELAATEVKKAITGNGHATKAQMQQVVKTICGLSVTPEPPDVADAIGIALCAGRRRAMTVSSAGSCHPTVAG